MENLAHSLTGAVLAKAGLERKVPFGTATLVVAANLPDFDSLAGWWGSLYYFHHHRGITHSLLGTAILGVLLAGLVWGLARSLGRPCSFRAVLGAVLLTLATHPLLDYTNSYGWRPYLPFSSRWVYGDLVFIVDPYLWILLGSTLFLAAPRRQLWIWLAGIFLLSLLLYWFAGIDPAGVGAAVVWSVSVGILLVLKGCRQQWNRRLCRLSLVGVVLYWGFLLAGRELTLASSKEVLRQSYPLLEPSGLVALPTPVHPFRWDIFFQDSGRLYYFQASWPAMKRLQVQVYPSRRDHPGVQAALQSCPGRVATHFARFELFEVRERREGVVVLIRDARYARDRDSGFGVFRVELTPDLKVRESPPCPQVPDS